MARAEKTSSKVRVHTQYRTSDGRRVPGVTTITGMIDKDALIHWAWELGLQGLDYKKYRDEKAEAGTLCHEMILAHHKGEKVDTSEYSPLVVDLAENAFLSYLEWEKGKEIEPIIAERPLVSDRLRYGGTPDLLAMVNGQVVLLDFKTGKGIYRTHWLQVAGYLKLLEEHGYPSPEKVIILNIPRTEDESFREEPRSYIWVVEKALPVFLGLLDVYYKLKEIK